MGLVRSLLPVSRIGMATWAWRNRTELGKWGRFAARSTTRLADGDRSDVAAEARLRLGLSRDNRTRNEHDLHLHVIDGIATLSGRAESEVQEAALRVAERTKGIRRVRNDMQKVGRRRDRRRRRRTTA